MSASRQVQRDSRAVLLTPPGSAAIAVVRLLGPHVEPFLTAHFSRTPKPGRAVHGQLADGDTVLDDPVVVLSEDRSTADLSVHGGPWVVQSLLDLAQRDGFAVTTRTTLPLPDEAVDGATVIGREVATHLPLARTDLALRVLLAQPEVWRQLQRRWQLTPPTEPEVAAILADNSLRWLLHPPRIAIVGSPNAGKSTLANQLFGQARSITADVPGTTRDWVGDIANVDGLAVMLIDTPGIRPTNDPIEHAAIARSGTEIALADFVVLVLDVTCPLEGPQRALIDAHPDALSVANKCDLPLAWDPAQVPGALPTVAPTAQGLDDLRRLIRQRFDCHDAPIARARWWTDRHRSILQRIVRDPNLVREI
jgi:tRNA modification GTPase